MRRVWNRVTLGLVGSFLAIAVATVIARNTKSGTSSPNQIGLSSQRFAAVENAPIENSTIAVSGPKGEGWPNIFGPSHNSRSDEANVGFPAAGPAIAWRNPIGEGYSSPVADGEDVIVFHRPRLSNTDGKSDAPGPDEVVTCFNAATGLPRWNCRQATRYICRTHYSNGPYSTPILEGERVYAWGTEGNLYCLNRKDGALIWNRKLLTEYSVKSEGYFPVATSPLLWKDRLILNVGGTDSNAGIVAVAKDDGKTLWTATDHAASHATPCAATIYGRTYVFVLTRQGMVALDPQTGIEYWQVRFRANNPEFVNATSPIVYGDIVFVSGYSVGNLCLQIQPDGTFRELWRDQRRNLDSQYNPLICIDGWLYGFSALDDTFRCLKLTTGEVQWRGLSELDRGAAIATGDGFIIWGTNGQLAFARISPKQLDVLALTKTSLIAGPTYAFPALHRGQLIVRNDRELVSIDLRKSARIK